MVRFCPDQVLNFLWAVHLAKAAALGMRESEREREKVRESERERDTERER